MREVEVMEVEVLIEKLEERVKFVFVLFGNVFERWVEKVAESVENGSLTLYGYSKLMEEVQKRFVDMLLVLERLVKLRKELEKLRTVDDAVLALAYRIAELGEEDKKEVLDLVVRKLRGRVGSVDE